MNAPVPDPDISTRLVVATSAEALDGLVKVITDAVIPFLKEWRSLGPQPLPSPNQIDMIKAKVRALIESAQPMPDGYQWLPTLLERLSSSLRFNGRNFVNIHPNPYVPSIVASALVALQNPNNIVEEVSKATTQLEKECVAWMAKELVGFDSKRADGNVVSGGTLANLTAMLVARDYCYRKLARPRPADVRSRGLYGERNGIILATAGSHYSIKKAAWILGLGDENVVRVPVSFDEECYRRKQRDEQFLRGIRDPTWSARLHGSCEADEQKGCDELQRFYRGEHEPFELQPLDSEIYKALYSCFQFNTPLIAYVFTIGTTDTGTIERPDRQALQLLEEEDVFVHADAAAGGFALMHKRVHEKVAGLNHVHSVTVDGHKLGHLAYPNAAVLFRDRSWMLEIMHDAPYLKNLAPTIEGSRPGTHVAALWAAIQDLGVGGIYPRWLDRLFAFRDALLKSFRDSKSFQILHRVDLTTVAVTPIPAEGEDRERANELARLVHSKVNQDTAQDAFLVNFDRELAGIKVRNSNRFAGGEPLEETDKLVDIQCIRIVITNPETDPTDAVKLVEYLERILFEVRNRH